MNERRKPHKKLRVLLIRNAQPYDFGGAERFVVNLSESLQEYGWDATIATAHTDILKLAQTEGITATRSPWWTRQDYSGSRIFLFPIYVAWQFFLTIWYVQLIARLKFDIVHPQSRDDFIAATIAGKLLGKRVVWTDHADLKYIYQNTAVPLKNPIGKWVRMMSRYAAAITLVSKSEQTLVAKALAVPSLPNNYQVIYNGITDQPIIPATRTNDEKKSVIFASTSRLVVAKGIGELIEAFTALDASNAYLWIIGDGPDAQKYQKLAAGNNRIIFKGYRSDALSLLAAADIFVHPSYHEGFSLSIIEAAMLGKPLVACNVGGNPEIVEDGINGILVPEKNAISLKNALRTLLQNKVLRAQYGVASRQSYLCTFQFDHIVKESFIPIYEK